MGEENSKDRHLNDSLAAAQLEKLNLEIEQLRNKDKWENRVTLYTPLLSVSIAVFGFLFGIYQFQRQQQIQQAQIINEQQKDRQSREREQTIRLQNQIRSDVDQILQFTNDKQQTVSRVRFLLESTEGNVKLSADSVRTDLYQNSKRNITIPLVQSVVDDCDFDQHRDVNYAFALVHGWDDYSDYLKGKTNVLEYILNKYLGAIDHIYDEDPSTVGSINFLEGEFSYSEGYGNLDTSKTYHFEDIILGFSTHLNLLEDKKVKEKYIQRFQRATCNARFTEQYFGIKFDPRSDPEGFSHCPRK